MPINRATRRAIIPKLFLFLSLVSGIQGCTRQMANRESLADLRPVALEDGRMPIQVRPCIDRTEFSDRNLGEEATDALITRLKKADEIRLVDNGRYLLNCDISGFVEGSSVKRWALPGWGATSAQVAVMVTDIETGDTVGIIRVTAEVSAGGLYTVGADKVILGVALEDVVRQLRQLAGRSAR